MYPMIMWNVTMKTYGVELRGYNRTSFTPTGDFTEAFELAKRLKANVALMETYHGMGD